MANGDDARACRSPAASYVSSVTVPRDSRPRLRPSCRRRGPAGSRSRRRSGIARSTVVPVATASSSRSRISSSRSPWSTAVEDRRHPRGAGPGSRARGSRPGSARSPGRPVRRSRGSSRRHPARRRSSGTSPGRRRGGRGPGRRPRRATTTPRAGDPAATTPTPTTTTAAPISADPKATCSDPGADPGAAPRRRSRAGSRTGRDRPPPIPVRGPAGRRADDRRTR